MDFTFAGDRALGPRKRARSSSDEGGSSPSGSDDTVGRRPEKEASRTRRSLARLAGFFKRAKKSDSVADPALASSWEPSSWAPPTPPAAAAPSAAATTTTTTTVAAAAAEPTPGAAQQPCPWGSWGPTWTTPTPAAPFDPADAAPRPYQRRRSTIHRRRATATTITGGMASPGRARSPSFSSAASEPEPDPPLRCCDHPPPYDECEGCWFSPDVVVDEDTEFCDQTEAYYQQMLEGYDLVAAFAKPEEEGRARRWSEDSGVSPGATRPGSLTGD
ncbi:hypothetical protein C8A00DRAFT_29988 [Chaetomidium leptoderma]|uniref:Uncharacterized protein n=1 Tax=Chaetomidium leptoderma TaxID=669021 RepID=A0AAN7A031_9PEZI|nr:hypothetical protein C8A00DRAFT_29988 [Chaetomidium leptoderma]